MRNSVTRPLFTALFILLLFGSFSASDPSVENRVVSYFQSLNKMPQEKLYLHLDKPYYGAGENIWFKGYLVDAMTHTNTSLSNFIYIELVNRGDSIIQRYKFKRDSLGFRGNIPLSATLPAGDYYLRGYTSWMQNKDSSFFYYHNLKISNALLTDIQATITERPSTANNGILKVRFSDAAGEPHRGVDILYKVSGKDQPDKPGKGQTDSTGVLTLTNLQSYTHGVRINTQFDNPDYEYNNTLYLDDAGTDEYAVSFFPEGGNLLNGVSQQVAFKAQAESGFSLPVSGFVTNAQGDTVSTFKSEHNGMGTLLLTPVAGEQYTAVTQSDKGIIKRHPLSPVEDHTVGLAMAQRNETIIYNVQKATNAVWPDSLYLVAHLRGAICMFIPLSETKASGKISCNIFPEGIIHFLLINQEGVPVSERLLFVRHPNPVDLSITTDKPHYTAREPIRMQISLTHSTGAPASGEFSVSVTDNTTVQQDSLGNNILSSLLLTSDLKGYIENPGHYFNNPPTPLIQRQLDLVMLTHGWRRFKIENINQAPVQPDIRHYIEIGQTVAGTVKNSMGKPLANVNVSAFSTDGSFMLKTTDEAGRFLIDSIQFNDTTAMMVQASNSKGETHNVDLSIDPETFPSVCNFSPYRTDGPQASKEYMTQMRDQYYYEGGERVVNLKEVSVEARVKSKEKDIYASMADQTITEDQIPVFMQNRPILDYLSTLSGITRKGDKLSIRNNANEPLILIDEVPYYNNEVLERIFMNEISSVSVIKGANAAFFGFKGGGGAISIKRKEGSAKVDTGPAYGVAFIKPLGFSEITEFYTPVYDTPEKIADKKPDIRTTIYWNPTLQFDSTGQASVLFYGSDHPNAYHINIEGITQEGYVTRYSGDL